MGLRAYNQAQRASVSCEYKTGTFRPRTFSFDGSFSRGSTRRASCDEGDQDLADADGNSAVTYSPNHHKSPAATKMPRTNFETDTSESNPTVSASANVLRGQTNLSFLDDSYTWEWQSLIPEEAFNVEDDPPQSAMDLNVFQTTLAFPNSEQYPRSPKINEYPDSNCPDIRKAVVTSPMGGVSHLSSNWAPSPFLISARHEESVVFSMTVLT